MGGTKKRSRVSTGAFVQSKLDWRFDFPPQTFQLKAVGPFLPWREASAVGRQWQVFPKATDPGGGLGTGEDTANKFRVYSVLRDLIAGV